MGRKLTKFRPNILSRHPSHSILRRKFKNLPLFGFRTVIRFGSSTPTSKFNGKSNRPNIAVEVNTVEACNNSASKVKMKKCFEASEVRTCKYKKGSSEGLEYPIVAKLIYGSRGKGMKYLKDENDYNQISNKSKYIFEEFFTGVREYRLHVTKNGCFYTCRKMLKSDTPEGQRYFRNDSNSIWALETNPKFDRPVNWKQIEQECVKALKSVGLDIGACDVRVQSAKSKDGSKRKDPDFRIIEINSAPSFGEITAQKYIEIIPKIINKKYNG